MCPAQNPPIFATHVDRSSPALCITGRSILRTALARQTAAPIETRVPTLGAWDVPCPTMEVEVPTTDASGPTMEVEVPIADAADPTLDAADRRLGKSGPSVGPPRSAYG